MFRLSLWTEIKIILFLALVGLIEIIYLIVILISKLVQGVI